MIPRPYIVTEAVRRCSILVAAKDYQDAREQAVTEQPEPVPVPEHLMDYDSVYRARLAQRLERAQALVAWFDNEPTFQHWFLKFYADDPLILMTLAGEGLRYYARASRMLKEQQ
jgi:hypothetical protein